VVSLGIFSVVPPTDPCALLSTQPLKVSTRDFSLGKGGRCFWLTTYHPCSAETSRKSGALIYPKPLGPPRPVAGDRYFTLLTRYSYPICIFCIVFFFEKYSNIKSHENLSSGSRVVQCGPTEERTDMTRLIIALHSFTNSPNKTHFI